MKHISYAGAEILGLVTVKKIAPVSQVGVGVFNACGIACGLMLLREVGLAKNETVTKWSQQIDAPQDGTTPADLARMLTQLGAVPVMGVKASYPYIELIAYDRLDPAKQWSVYRGHKFNHWIVRVSDTVYYDPLFPAGQGGPIVTTKAILDGAEISPGSRVAIKEKFIQQDKSMAQVTDAKVITEVRVRTAPTVSEATWTPLALKEGQTLSGETLDGWLKYSDPRFVVYGEDGKRRDALYSILKQGGTEFIRIGNAPAPAPTPVLIPTPNKSAFKMGVSVLIAHQLLQPAYDAGCRAFLVMDGLMAALQFKQGHPDATVMYRRYIRTSGIPDPNSFSGEAGIGNGVIVMTPLNECDSFCYGSPSEIEARARFDTALAHLCQDKGTIYAAGGFSMGTPDFTRPDICEAMRQFYAPGYNSGLFAMNMHLYSPTMDHVYKREEWQWYERRWEFLFTKCGFDPDPKLRGIYCDETGVDEGGVGGFTQHGANSEIVAAWSREFRTLSELPLTINGKTYPSPMRAAAIFQAGNSQDWAGYNVQPFLADIGRANS